jgi:hypothetical protein
MPPKKVPLPEIEKSKSLVYTEIFDKNALSYIIDHFNELIPQISPFSTHEPETIRKMLIHYITRSRDGEIRVIYHQKRPNFGRYFAEKSISLQGIARPVRQTIAAGYTDIDIKNAHPVILQFLSRAMNLETPFLDDYIVNREQRLAEVVNALDGKKSREWAKKQYLILERKLQ